MAEHDIAVLHQRFQHLKSRALLIGSHFTIWTVLDLPIQGQQAWTITVLCIQLLPEVSQRVGGGIGTLTEVPR
jgi:hypothetical protein